DQLQCLFVRELLLRRDEAESHCAVAHQLQVDARAVVRHRDGHLGAHALSSATVMTPSEPSRFSATSITPASSLPAATRAVGSSMPCTIALRSMCSKGASMR